MTNPTVAVEQPKMPSADLINYRFDQTDKKFVELGAKLDHLTNHFATKQDFAELQRRLDAHLSERRWKSRMLATAAYGALFLSLGTLVVALILSLTRR